MSYPKRIQPFRPKNGLLRDVPPSEVPDEYYTTAGNVLFRDSFAERVVGDARVYPGVTGALRNILSTRDSAGANFWMYSSPNTVNAVTGSTISDLTPIGGLQTQDDPNAFTTSLLNGLPVWNNQLDVPHYWTNDPGAPLAPLPGWQAGDTCRAIRPFKFHLFALGMEEAGGSFPMKLKWSDAAEPGAVPQTWEALPNNDAGDTQLSETPGGIVDAWPLRAGLMIYKESSTYLCNWIAGQFVFNFRPLFITSGVIARNCVVEHDARHFVFTDDDLIMTDGNTIQSIVDRRNRKALFSSLDQDNARNAYVINYERQKEIWFCYPENGSKYCNRALVYDVRNDSTGFRELCSSPHGRLGFVTDAVEDDSWDSDTQAWDDDVTSWTAFARSDVELDLVIACTDDDTPTNGKLVEVDAGSDFDGEPINALLVKSDMSFGDADRLKLVKRVYPKVEANDGVTVDIRVGSAESPGGTVSWSPPVPYVKGTNTKIDTFSLGRYISIEISSAGGAPWTLIGFDVEYETRGYY